jgi:hypothetical protein
MKSLFASWVIAMGIAASGAAGSPSLPVPVAVQQAIKRQVNPVYVLIPAFVPPGERYERWTTHQGSGLQIWFQRDGAAKKIGFSVSLIGSCLGPGFGPTRTFTFGGVKVYWSGTYEDQQAWRCIKSRVGPTVLMATQSIPGAQEGSHWARDLARVVASAHRIA